MSQFRDDLKAPYTEIQDKANTQMARNSHGSRLAREEQDNWPKLRNYLAKRTFPALTKRQEQLDEALAPIELTALKDARVRLSKLPRLTWWNPWAFRIRLSNFAIRLCFFGFRLLQLTAILLVIYELIRLIWLLV